MTIDPAETSLTQTASEMHSLSAELKAHQEAAATEEKRLRSEITKRQTVLSLASEGIDYQKVAFAKTIIGVMGEYERGGKERASVLSDAIRQLSTGDPIRLHYGDLWCVQFGTKNYDQWSGQRCDCEYGMGPMHGSLVFGVGLLPDIRKRDPKALTPEETEAAIYYLVNLERIQAAEKSAREAA